jgi:hypothetical protein
MEAGTIDMTAWLGFNGIPKMGYAPHRTRRALGR